MICLFEVCYRAPAAAVSILGTLKNYNTIEEFKAADKMLLFNEEAHAARWTRFKQRSTLMFSIDLG